MCCHPDLNVSHMGQWAVIYAHAAWSQPLSTNGNSEVYIHLSSPSLNYLETLSVDKDRRYWISFLEAIEVAAALSQACISFTTPHFAHPYQYLQSRAGVTAAGYAAMLIVLKASMKDN